MGDGGKGKGGGNKDADKNDKENAAENAPTSAAAPPPPPKAPPLPIAPAAKAATTPPPRTALNQEIHKGKKLRKVVPPQQAGIKQQTPGASRAVGVARTDLPSKSAKGPQVGGLAGLGEALANRRAKTEAKTKSTTAPDTSVGGLLQTAFSAKFTSVQIGLEDIVPAANQLLKDSNLTVRFDGTNNQLVLSGQPDEATIAKLKERGLDVQTQTVEGWDDVFHLVKNSNYKTATLSTPRSDATTTSEAGAVEYSPPNKPAGSGELELPPKPAVTPITSAAAPAPAVAAVPLGPPKTVPPSDNRIIMKSSILNALNAWSRANNASVEFEHQNNQLVIKNLESLTEPQKDLLSNFIDSANLSWEEALNDNEAVMDLGANFKLEEFENLLETDLRKLTPVEVAASAVAATPEAATPVTDAPRADAPGVPSSIAAAAAAIGASRATVEPPTTSDAMRARKAATDATKAHIVKALNDHLEADGLGKDQIKIIDSQMILQNPSDDIMEKLSYLDLKLVPVEGSQNFIVNTKPGFNIKNLEDGNIKAAADTTNDLYATEIDWEAIYKPGTPDVEPSQPGRRGRVSVSDFGDEFNPSAASSPASSPRNSGEFTPVAAPAGRAVPVAPAVKPTARPPAVPPAPAIPAVPATPRGVGLAMPDVATPRPAARTPVGPAAVAGSPPDSAHAAGDEALAATPRRVIAHAATGAADPAVLTTNSPFDAFKNYLREAIQNSASGITVATPNELEPASTRVKVDISNDNWEGSVFVEKNGEGTSFKLDKANNSNEDALRELCRLAIEGCEGNMDVYPKNKQAEDILKEELAKIVPEKAKSFSIRGKPFEPPATPTPPTRPN